MMKNKGQCLREWILKPSSFGALGFPEQKWIRNFLLLIFFLCMHLAITRFPLIDSDSKRYLNMAVFGHPNVLAPTLVSWMLGPLCHLIGAWAFAAFQIVLLSYVLATFLEYFRMP
ncbi:MAG: hypothetical protein ABH891_08100, partial [Candidatus Omnitrophota bacterium]